MRRSQIIQEFDLLAEVLPIALAGILLNVAGRQIAQYYSGPFVDMTGTAFTAFLLGPWWAAAVASATTIINGNFFENYFPFGVVNIMGGLVWGYLARRADLPNRVFTWKEGASGRIVLWTLILTVAGGFACGLASTCVKLVLYPELGRPFIYGSLYASTHEMHQRYLGPAASEVVTLLVVDLARDLLDKAIVVPAAMTLVALTRIAPTFGEMSALVARGRVVRTDIPSIFFFAVTYSAFIFLAQQMRPSISIPGSVREVAWLGNPMMVLLLYAPLVLALIAFQFLTFRSSDTTGRRLHVLCRERRSVRRKLFEAGGRWTSFVRSVVPQVLGTGVSIWPLRHIIDPMFGVPLALGAIVLALAAYLVIARVFYLMLQRALQKFEAITHWLEVDSGPTASAKLVELMSRVFSAYISVPEKDIARRNGLVYTLGFVNREQLARFQDFLFGRGEDAAGGPVAVLATLDPPRTLTETTLKDVASLAHDSGAGLVAIASTTQRLTEPGLIEGLRALRKNGVETLLFDWRDLQLSVATNVLNGRPQATMRRSRAQAFKALNANDERFVVEEQDRAQWLSARALPSLRAVIGDLPKASTVFDLGSGYGRHTLAASIAGHDVLAVERKAHVCERLREDAKSLAPKGGKVAVVQGDFLDMTPETIGIAELVICTGVLQHARHVDDLSDQLSKLASFANQPAALIYIEMLFDMLFDGRPPSDGRIQISCRQFEELLRTVFPAGLWAVQRLAGPTSQVQIFDGGGRSFEPPARTIESASAEYLIRRLE